MKLIVSLVDRDFQKNDGDAKDDVLNVKEPIERVKQPHGFGPTLCQWKLALCLDIKLFPVKYERWTDDSPQGMQKEINVFPESSSSKAKIPDEIRQGPIRKKLNSNGVFLCNLL